jgi:hypothetical protein
MNCNDQIVGCLPNGCGCVKYDPVTGQLAIDGELVKLYMQPTASVTAETLTGKVLNPAIEVGASAITGLCAAIGPCMAALPPGSIDVSALKPGAEGTVLQTLGGVVKWSGLDDAAIQKAFGDNPVPQPPIDGTELARVYGEDSSQKLTSVKPEGVYEAGAANMPLVTAGAPLKQITGLNAGGMAVKANVTASGQRIEGVSTPATNQPFTTGSNYVVASVKVPVSGLYGIEIGYTLSYKYAGGPAVGPNSNAREWYVSTSSGRPYDVILVDWFAALSAQTAGQTILLDTVKTGTAIVKLSAGETVTVALYVNGATAQGTITASGSIVLIKLSDADIALAG